MERVSQLLSVHDALFCDAALGRVTAQALVRGVVAAEQPQNTARNPRQDRQPAIERKRMDLCAPLKQQNTVAFSAGRLLCASACAGRRCALAARLVHGKRQHFSE